MQRDVPLKQEPTHIERVQVWQSHFSHTSAKQVLDLLIPFWSRLESGSTQKYRTATSRVPERDAKRVCALCCRFLHERASMIKNLDRFKATTNRIGGRPGQVNGGSFDEVAASVKHGSAKLSQYGCEATQCLQSTEKSYALSDNLSFF